MFEELKMNHFSDIPTITVDDLIKNMDVQNFVFVDVRSPEERAVSFIPGSITIEEFEKNKAKYIDAKIITYCTIG